MTQQQDNAVTIDRAVMAAIGGAAGLALWLHVDLLPDHLENLRFVLLSAALMLGGFAIVMALVGPVRLGRVVPGALVLAIPAALLAFWASWRFAEVEGFWQAGHGAVAYGLILFVGTPFVAAALHAPGGWRDYARLFDISWTIVVRYVAGGLFVGLFWAVLMLSDGLLQLVGVDVIERLIEQDAVPYVLSGVVLGLALAVVHELRDYVSPFLIHRLMRLLLPVLLLVELIFLLALPLRGLSGLFGQFSAAATLMGVSFAGITLVSTALDRSDAEAADSKVMVWSARGVSLVLPVLSGLALYAVWLRVGQYGWTPQRLMAAMAGGYLLAYGLAYAGAVLGAGAWMARVRRANLWMAIALVAGAALWLTPVINAERISAQSQLGRAVADLQGPEAPSPGDMALWQLAHEWGIAGAAALVRLEQAAQGQDEIVNAIAWARAANSRYAYSRQLVDGDPSHELAELVVLLAVRPETQEIPQGALAGLSGRYLDQWLMACRNRLDDGRPGCVAVFGEFRPGLEVPHGFVLLNHPGGHVRATGIVLRGGQIERFGGARSLADPARQRQVSPVLKPDDIAAALDGAFEIVPSGINALKIGDMELIPEN
jgi:hypothetical protein